MELRKLKEQASDVAAQGPEFLPSQSALAAIPSHLAAAAAGVLARTLAEARETAFPAFGPRVREILADAAKVRLPEQSFLARDVLARTRVPDLAAEHRQLQEALCETWRLQSRPEPDITLNIYLIPREDES